MMKHSIFHLCTLCLFCVLCASCENKWPKNGDLDGNWQLLTIEHKGETTDVKEKQLFLSIQLDLFQLSVTGDRQRYYGYFDKGDNTIVFRQFSDMAENDPATTDNRPLTSAAVLHRWGYYTLHETFRIERLSKQEMILQSDSARVTYRKF
ncbi:MAG: lipocalin-like domain-containing protein [Bacteroidaceae bacterium]|nr:lipocalin-like domain-containing protein [Bacteroidaceae bacterium]